MNSLFWIQFIDFSYKGYGFNVCEENRLQIENMEYWRKLEKEDLDRERFEYQVEGDG